ncbi:MAG TPA: hypothetical protein VFI31_12825 [Pirellulales bacterium]|nr:hypothetical protein [Pirellulales bacterium]
MRGLLADKNVERHMLHLRDLLQAMGLSEILTEVGVEFFTFTDADLPFDIDDLALWQRCQQEGFVLFTDNRNEESIDSLQSTLVGLWKSGDLPIITLARKSKFEQDAAYRERVAADVAEIVFGIAEGQYRDRDRIYVPL